MDQTLLPDASDSFEDHEKVDLLGSDFLARYREGDLPTIEEYTRRHPDLSQRIRQMFPLILSLEKVKHDRQTGIGQATLAGHEFQRLGDFTIQREIGRGGMGVVYEARQESLGRSVAIKVIPRHTLLDDQSLARFGREARMAASMHHSHIVPVFGTGEVDGTHYLVMQLVEGVSLDRKIPTKGPLSFHETARLGVEIADALAYAHQKGVLHRDVKPGNILMDSSGTARISDFGLAKIASEDASRTHVLSGSLRYLAPERFLGQSDVRSDIYSLGLTLFEAVAGTPAFEAADSEQLIGVMMNPPAQSLRSHRADVPLDLETIILKAMNPDASLRYQTAAELRDDLARFLAHEPILARRATLPQRIVRAAKRNPRMAWAVGTTACALLITTVVSLAAYLTTSDANKRAVAALEQSEGTVDLALDTLAEVVEAVSLSPERSLDVEIPGNEAPLPELSHPPSPFAARVLEQIQPLYERLAQQVPTRPDIVFQRVDASIQLARIQNQLGRTNHAIATLQESLKLLLDQQDSAALPEFEENILLARLFNELGILLSVEYRFGEADEAHLQALMVSEPFVPDHHAAQLEFARACVLLSDLPPQRRRNHAPTEEIRQQQRNYIERAIVILTELSKFPEYKTSGTILLARSLLAKSRFEDTETSNKPYFEEAIDLLRNYLKAAPDEIAVRFELVKALERFDLRRQKLSPAQLIHAETQFQEALAVLRPLRSRLPETPAFAMAEIHLCHKLSAIYRRQRKPQEALDYLQQAIAVQSSLLESQPNSISFLGWRALLYRTKAELLQDQGQPKAAQLAIETAHQDLARIPQDAAQHPFIQEVKDILRRFSDRPAANH